MDILGFDWDEGNREKCAGYGLTFDEIESVFRSNSQIMVNTSHNAIEERYHAVGITEQGRYAFIVFTLRDKEEGTLIRPISARYMHQKEIDHYEKQKKS